MKYGEFVDAMREVANGAGVEAESIFNEWFETATEEQRKGFYDFPLGEGEVRNFAEDMATMFRRVIASTDGEELWIMRIRDGHAFLQAIRARCVELGIDVSNIRTDVPLSPSDAIRMAQAETT